MLPLFPDLMAPRAWKAHLSGACRNLSVIHLQDQHPVGAGVRCPFRPTTCPPTLHLFKQEPPPSLSWRLAHHLPPFPLPQVDSAGSCDRRCDIQSGSFWSWFPGVATLVLIHCFTRRTNPGHRVAMLGWAQMAYCNCSQNESGRISQ